MDTDLTNVLISLGNTLLITLQHFKPQSGARILVKMENTALRVAEKLGPEKTIVTLVVDSGLRI